MDDKPYSVDELAERWRCAREAVNAVVRSPRGRLHDLETGNPDVELLGVIADTRVTEWIIHRVLREYHHRNDWLHLVPKIRRMVEELCRG